MAGSGSDAVGRRRAPATARGLTLAAAVAAMAPAAAAPPVAGLSVRAWHGTLLARDINADGVVDAYFDTTLRLTWLADADAIRTSGKDADGLVTAQRAAAWVDGLDVHGVGGWRLPSYRVRDGSLGAIGEIEHLYRHVLGNTPYLQPGWTHPTDPGPFRNLRLSHYWYAETPPWPMQLNSYVFNWEYGRESTYSSSGRLPVWAVRDGDVLRAVPEPATAGSMIAGALLVAAVVARRRRAFVRSAASTSPRRTDPAAS